MQPKPPQSWAGIKSRHLRCPGMLSPPRSTSAMPLQGLATLTWMVTWTCGWEFLGERGFLDWTLEGLFCYMGP